MRDDLGYPTTIYSFVTSIHGCIRCEFLDCCEIVIQIDDEMNPATGIYHTPCRDS